MPRIRTLKPEFFMSPQVMNLSLGARLLFIGLITQADDEGRGIADPRKLKSLVFPGDDEVTPAVISGFFSALQHERLCVVYSSDDHGELYALPSWKRHQKVEKARESHYPRPPRTVTESSPMIPRVLPESSPMIPHGSDLILSDQGSDQGPDQGSDRTLPDQKRPEETRAREALPPLHVDRGALASSLQKSVKHRNGSNGTKSPEELRLDARKLHEAGNAVGDIVKLLGHYHVTAAQVQEWIA